MLISRGGALGALWLVAAGMFAAGPAAQAQDPADGVTIAADIKLTDDGLLQVAEKVQVPPGGQFHMVLPLRVAFGDSGERRFSVTDIGSTGAGKATLAGDLFTVDAQPGDSSFTYTVHNTVNDAQGSQVFRWTGVLNTDVASITASVISPSFRMGIADCKIGPAGQQQPCADVRVEPDGVLTLNKEGLRKGDIIDLSMQLPPGTVAPNADIHDGNDSSAFSFGTPVLVAFGALVLALLAAAGFVLWSRRQDAAALGAHEALDPVQHKDDRAEFVSPDGVLPGAAGLLLDASPDATDLAATVVDLAVRRYLWITPISDSDWRINRVNAADDQLRDYEREVYRALLPDGTDSVQVSELRGRVAATSARSALLADAAANGTLTAPHRRGPSFWLGVVLLVVGVAATIGLAIAGRYALVGVAVALGGVAALFLPRYLPRRTATGRALAGRIRALQRGLDNVQPDRIPPADRELVFSRALPFTIIGGRVDNWIRTFRDLDPTADRDPGLYWFGGFDRDRNLHRFAGHFPYFITALEGLFA
ncbi:DUF2207 family protein [Nocardia sp. alder85J]|uniref:DUF2207 family protein n=1 Tax=Nocardia sp. alder85J TaxID=2862949 RepID=UPI001CD444B2|nr:DUF2207 domain-containing protein [Nocardia sp. alder85J]MCX4093750.1 DUF2207 domain-containing protein [Nocardia sp. alder85J]